MRRRRLLLVAGLLALLGVAGMLAENTQAGAGKQSRPPAAQPRLTWDNAGLVWCRLKGRVLGSLVQSGMTPQQVEQVLGKGSNPLPTIGLTGAGTFGCWRYDHLGLTVRFHCDRSDTLQVEGVTFRPLFD
jgi:hypothetical protein